MTDSAPRVISYEERHALNTLRKSMRHKPWLIEELMKDMAYTQAASILMQAGTELTQLLEVNRAFVAAASVLAKQQKESEQ